MSIHVNDLIEKYVNLKEKGMNLSEIRNELKIQQIDVHKQKLSIFTITAYLVLSVYLYSLL